MNSADKQFYFLVARPHPIRDNSPVADVKSSVSERRKIANKARWQNKTTLSATHGFGFSEFKDSRLTLNLRWSWSSKWNSNTKATTA